MSKGSSNYKSKRSHTSKPYDASQSFVAKVASRVSEILPQTTWLNRWLSPAEANIHRHGGSSQHVTSTPSLDLHGSPLSVDGPGPSKRPRLPLNSPFLHNNYLQSTAIHEEELSPIAAPPNDIAVAGPSGLNQLSQRNNYTPRSSTSTAGDPPQSKLEDKLTSAAQRSSTPAATATVTSADKLNGDDCSETSESTSGCSSLVPQAQHLQSRRSESRHLSFSGNRSVTSGFDRSIFPGRSSPKVDLTSLHRRRPSFDTTAFTSSSKLLHITANPNQTSSPFYSGRTMYGGASAYNTSSSGLFSTPRRSGVTVRPVNVNSPAETALSTTAKKILDALEQFSTPVVDAKRLPIVPGTKRKLERYAELNLPTTSELLRVKRRERLQKSTSAARQASLSSSHQSSNSNSGQPETDYRIGNNAGNKKHTGKLTRNYCLESGGIDEEVNLPAAVLPVQTLPNIDIPVPPPKPLTTTVSSTITSSTPISAATFTARNPMSVETTSVSTSSTKPTAVTPSREFNISEPVSVKADVSSRTSLSAEQFHFVFSEPIVQSNKNVNSGLSCLNFNKGKDNSNMFSCKNTVSESNSGSSGKVIGLGFNIKSNVVSTNVSTLGVKKVVESSPVTPVSATINSDSISRSPDNNNYWKCSMCMVRNNPETNVCIACDAKKTIVTFSSSSVTSSSPLKFKPPPDTWECKECYVRNKNSVAVCAACASPRGSNQPIVSSSSNTSTIVSTVPSFSSVTSVVSTSTTSVTSTNYPSGFGDKFKPPSDTWECKECFVRNKNSTDECISCGSKFTKNVKKDVVPTCSLVSSNTPVSSGFGNLFKKPEGSWECGSCMVRNDAKSVKCVACETPKPGAEKSTTTNNKLAVTSSATSSITSCGFQFGIPQGTPNESKGVLSSNNNKEGFKITEFQFGSSKPSNTTASATTAAPTFTFGIPQSKPLTNDESLPKEKKNKTLVNDKLPSNPLQELAKLQEKQTGIIQSSGFIFSASNDTTVEKKEVNVDSNISKNLFGVVDKTKANDLSNKIEDASKTSTSTPVSNAFAFGATSTLDKTDSTNKTSNFIFQPKTDQTTSAATKLVFGNATTTQNQETKKSTISELFDFGNSAKRNNSSAVFSSSTAKPNAPFLFGTAASTNENKSGMLFGATSTDKEKPAVSVPEIKPVFGNTSKESTSIFGNIKPDVKLPVFGGGLVNDTKPAVSNALTNSTGVKFGAVNSNANTGSLQSGFKQETPATTPSFLFGSSAPSPFQSQSNSQQPDKALFSLTNSTNNTNIQSVPPATQASTAFSFGAGTASTINNEPPKSTFGFSSQTPQPSGFSFNPASSTTPAQNFNFTPKEAESSSTGFNFSAVPAVQSNPAAPAFGVQQNAVPSFGNSNLFSFGSQSAQPQSVQPASSTPVFGFNSSQANAAVPNAFVFGSSNADATAASAASTTPAVPAFDPNARPTFNFTGGSTPSFTATPAPGTPVSSQVSRRPIKKAVRRSGQIR